MADTQKVFLCPTHGVLYRRQVRGGCCTSCGAPVEAAPMRVELVSFDRELHKRQRPRKAVHHADC
jgi:hypothetical protein